MAARSAAGGRASDEGRPYRARRIRAAAFPYLAFFPHPSAPKLKFAALLASMGALRVICRACDFPSGF